MRQTAIALSLLAFSCILIPAKAQRMNKIVKREYSLQSPSDWSVDSSKQMGTDLILFSMLENSYDKFRDNVTVIIKPLANSTIDLAKYTAISISQIHNMAPDANIESSTIVKAGIANYQKVIYTATQSGFRLKFEQYNFVANKKAYVITLTTEQTKFDAYKPVGEMILNSFVLR